MSLTVPEIRPQRTQRVNLRPVRGEFFRFLVRVREVDPDAVQPADPAEPRVMRPYNLADHDVTLAVKQRSDSPGNLLLLTRGDGLVVDDGAGTILVDLSDERTEVLGVVNGDVLWDHGVYRLRIEQPEQGDAFNPLKGEFWIDP